MFFIALINIIVIINYDAHDNIALMSTKKKRHYVEKRYNASYFN